MSDSPDIFASSGVDAPAKTSPEPASDAQPYRVLARKYRPSNFAEMVGHDAMVQTLGNAIKRDRLAHAFLMTGVRGVGKTTTARLIAKALNCIGEDGEGEATIDSCGICEPCRSIAEGRFIDVIEMDAASHTGVDDVREIIEAVRYSSVSARYKIYIIDEVHMLSKNAFNALLKTLEEPPPHVKFIFATTEVNKIPITVLSRCQRFDLKRISAEQLSQLFADIVAKEGVLVEQEALDLIAQVAEGSARDGLSILDQAIAHSNIDGDGGGDGEVKAVQIREMLGLSDRSAVRQLFGLLLAAKSEELLDAIDAQYKIGVEPLALMNGLLSLCHQVTLYKVGRASDPTLSDEAKAQFADWAEQLSYPVLHRLWQLLMKGYDEVRQAHVPREACDMALLRVLCAADMPDPGELAKLLQKGAMPSGSTNGADSSSGPAKETAGVDAAKTPSAASQPAMSESSGLPDNFQAVIDIVGETSPVLESILIADMRIVRFAPPEIGYQSARPIAAADLKKITDALREKTGARWIFREVEGEAQPSQAEQAQIEHEAARQEILETPVVKAAFEAFPGAELLDEGDPPMLNKSRSSSA